MAPVSGPHLSGGSPACRLSPALPIPYLPPSPAVPHAPHGTPCFRSLRSPSRFSISVSDSIASPFGPSQPTQGSRRLASHPIPRPPPPPILVRPSLRPSAPRHHVPRGVPITSVAIPLSPPTWPLAALRRLPLVYSVAFSLWPPSQALVTSHFRTSISPHAGPLLSSSACPRVLSPLPVACRPGPLTSPCPPSPFISTPASAAAAASPVPAPSPGCPPLLSFPHFPCPSVHRFSFVPSIFVSPSSSGPVPSSSPL